MGEIIMNFLDAHKIVHEYCGAVAKSKETNSLMYISKSFLPFTFDEQTIIDSFKIFFAHMILYSTRTSEEYEQYKIMSNLMNYFVDNDVYDEIIYSSNIANGKRPLLNKKLKLYNIAVKKKHYYMDKMAELMKKAYSVDHYYDFFVIMQEKKKELVGLYKGETFKQIKLYVDECYKQIGLEMQSIYYEFFLPFSTMRKHLNDERYAKNYIGYEDYILTHK